MNAHDKQHRAILQNIARRAMLKRGLLPEFPPEALAELDGIHRPAIRTEETTRDLRNLIWCSIDNDDSRVWPKPCLPMSTLSSRSSRPL